MFGNPEVAQTPQMPPPPAAAPVFGSQAQGKPNKAKPQQTIAGAPPGPESLGTKTLIGQ